MQRLIFILSFLICYSSFLAGQEQVDSSVIEALAKDYLSDKKTYGLSVATIAGDEISYYNLGRQSATLDSLPSEHHLYEIASITKTMTAAALAGMVYDDKVSYGDPISKFLPSDVVSWDEVDEITLMDLVTHQSGLPRLPLNLFMTVRDKDNPYANYHKEDLYAFLGSYKPITKAERKVEYSNLGFGLLGHILTIADSLSYEGMLALRVLDRIGEGQAYVELSGQAKELMMQGHKENGKETCLWDKSVLAGAGSVKANAKFMIHYLKEQLDNPIYASLHKPIIEGQCMAWSSARLNDTSFIWHNGGTYGFSSFGAFSKEDKVAVIVLSNTGKSVDKLGINILKELIKK